MHAATQEAAVAQVAVLKAVLQEDTEEINKFAEISVKNAGATTFDLLGEVSEQQHRMTVDARKLDAQCEARYPWYSHTLKMYAS
jgi:hypothetical protein